MKKINGIFKPGIYVIIVLMAAMCLASPVLAQDTSCKTKYPIILAHMAGFGTGTDPIMQLLMPTSFPGIVEALKACGATVYTPKVPALQTNLTKAVEFKKAFLAIKAADGSAKFNIIGHQAGGLYTRTAITNMGLKDSVASLTTVNTPHRGSTMLTLVSALYDIKILDSVLSMLKVLPGDQAYAQVTYKEMSTPYMLFNFNPNTPNVRGVYYQSWTSAYRVYDINKTFTDVQTLLTKILNGGTLAQTDLEIGLQSYALLPDIATLMYYTGFGIGDGLVQASSAKWGNFLGVQQGPASGNGVNHMDVVGLELGGVDVWDQASYWVQTVKDLKAKGY